MSAEKIRLGNTPNKSGEPIGPQARLSLVEAAAKQETSARSEPAESFPDKFLDPAPDNPPEQDPTLEMLLRAIHEAESARGPESELPAGIRNPQALAAPLKAPFAAARFVPSSPAVMQPVILPAIPRPISAHNPTPTLLVQARPNAASSGLMPPPTAPPRRPLASAASTNFKDHDTRAYLLRAIRTTETARRLKREMPAETPRPQAPKPIAPLKNPLPISTAKVAPLSPANVQQPQPPSVLRIDSAPSSALARLVQASPPGASPWLMPPPNAPSRRPLPPKTTEPCPIAIVPQAPSPTPTMPAGSALAIAPPDPFASFQRESSIDTFLASRRADLGRLAAALTQITEIIVRAVSRFSVRLRHWLETKPIPAMESLARAGLQISARFKTWSVSEAAPALGRVGRISSHALMRLMNWSGAKAASGLGCTSHAISQLSIQLKNWSDASATRRTIRTDSRPPSQLKNSSITEAARAAKSLARPKPQQPSALRNLFGPRRSPRLLEPPLVAYCWTADTPHSLKIADISSGGVHLLTDVRWPVGGRFSMTLQRTDRAKESPESWVVIDFVVIRWCKDGVAGAFIPSTHPLSRFAMRAENCADPETLKHFVKKLTVPAHR